MAGFGFSLGGSKSSGSSKSSTISNESGTSTTVRLSPEQLDLVQQLTSMLAGQLGAGQQQFSAGQARADVQSTVDQIFQQYVETALPQIYGKSAQAGAFNSTTAQLLANDAFARTAQQAGALTMQAIQQYATLGQQERQTTLGGIQALLQAQLGAQETTNYSKSGTSSTRSSGSSSSFGAKLGLSNQ